MRNTRITSLVVAVSALAVALTIGVVAVIGSASAQEEPERRAPSVSVYPTVAKLHSSTSLVVAATGFTPGEELRFLLEDAHGVTSDISGWLVTHEGEFEDEQGTAPAIANAAGSFAGRFPMGRFERNGAEGAWGIIVMNADYSEVLASTPLVFCDPDGRSRVGIYKRGAPDYVKNPDDPRPERFCSELFEYPERPAMEGSGG